MIRARSIILYKLVVKLLIMAHVAPARGIRMILEQSTNPFCNLMRKMRQSNFIDPKVSQNSLQNPSVCVLSVINEEIYSYKGNVPKFQDKNKVNTVVV